MKGKRKNRAVIIVMVLAVMVFMLSGFTGKNMDYEYCTISELLTQRTVLMQKVMFDSSIKAEDISEELSGIETQPTLGVDWQILKNLEGDGCGYDRILNMHVDSVHRLFKKANLYFYEVYVTWYMSGEEGHYENSEHYMVRTISNNKNMKLSDIQLMEDYNWK